MRLPGVRALLPELLFACAVELRRLLESAIEDVCDLSTRWGWLGCCSFSLALRRWAHNTSRLRALPFLSLPPFLLVPALLIHPTAAYLYVPVLTPTAICRRTR